MQPIAAFQYIDNPDSPPVFVYTDFDAAAMRRHTEYAELARGYIFPPEPSTEPPAEAAQAPEAPSAEPPVEAAPGRSARRAR